MSLAKRIFVTSDQHFLHRNIIKYDKRPYKNEIDMSWDLIKRWNRVVKPKDKVYHLGDLFCGINNRWDLAMTILRSLNGNITLIPGNHDYNKNIYKQEGIEVVGDIYLIVNDVLMSHYPRRIIHTKRYKDGQRISNAKNKLKNVYKKNKCKHHFYGHSHNYPAKKPNELNVSCTLHDYTPIRVFGLLD